MLILLLVALVGAGAVAGWWRTRTRPAVPPAVPEGLRPEVAAAITAARNEVVKNPTNGPAWGVLGLNFTAHGLDDQAAECFREAHRLAPDSDRWPYLLALYYQTDARDPARAVALLETALALPHRTPQGEAAIRLRLAEAYLERSRPADAEPLFRQHLAGDPQNPRASVGLGITLLTANRPAEALAVLAAATDSPFTRRKALGGLAVASRLVGDPAAAAQYEQRAARLPEDLAPSDPFVAEAAALRVDGKGGFEEVEALEKQGRLRETIPVLARMAEDPANVRAAVLLGQNLARLGDFAAAEPYLRAAAARDPQNVQAALALATTLYDLAQAEPDPERRTRLLRDSAEAGGRAVKLSPTLGMAHLTRGMALQALGDVPGALAHLRLAAECRPEVLQVQLALLKALVDAGQVEEARGRLPAAQRVVPAEHPLLIEIRKRLDSHPPPKS